MSHITIHVQDPVDHWLDIVIKSAAAGRPLKAIKVFHPENAREIKNLSPSTAVIFRHYLNNQRPLLDRAGISPAEADKAANTFILQFKDSVNQHMAGLTGVYAESLNETMATHDPAEQHKSVEFDRAFIRRLAVHCPGVKPAVFNVAVGNPDHDEYEPLLILARECKAAGGLMCLHSYWPVVNGHSFVNSLGHQHDLHMKFAAVDDYLAARGIASTWFLSEGGATSANDNGYGLTPNDGWKSVKTWNGNWPAYLADIKEMDKLLDNWNRTHGGRLLGYALFTTNPDAEGEWKDFRIHDGFLVELADYVAATPSTPIPPTPPPPPPPPPPVTPVFVTLSPAVRPVTLVTASNLRSSPRVGDNITARAKAGAQFEHIGNVKGQLIGGTDEWAKVSWKEGEAFLWHPAAKFAAPPEPTTPPVPTGRQTVTDISRHNTAFNSQTSKYVANDFTKMKAQGAVACIHRATLGASGEDPALAINWPAMQDAGLFRGYYHLFITGRGGAAQLANVTGREAVYGRPNLPWVIDVEPIDGGRINGNEVGEFLALFAGEMGYQPLVYTARWVADYVDGDKSWFTAYRLLLADYLSQPPAVGYVPLLPPGATAAQVVGHQWTSDHYDGRTWGVASSGIDVSVFYEYDKLLL